MAPCTPALAAGQQAQCAGGPGSTSPFPTGKGQALGQFAAFLACAGQEKMATLGYSPLPPILVQADFNAIGRLNGGQQPPPPTATNCKNPYVDGEIVLPGSPVVIDVKGYVPPPTTGPSTTLGPGGGSGGKGSQSGSGGSSSGGSGGANGISAAAAAAGLTPELAAQGYTVVNGHLVKKLCTTPACQFKHANSLVAATDAVADPTAGMYIGWALLVLGAILLPPLIALRITRKRPATADGDPSEPDA